MGAESGAVHDVSELICPHCKAATVETARNVPFVRGYALAHQQGRVLAIGCVPCVGRRMRSEAGRNLLYGWFSPQALVLTLAFVPWNFFRSLALSPDRAAVDRALRELGVPDAKALESIDHAVYGLMAAMIKADGVVDDAELRSVDMMGMRLVPNYDPAELRARLDVMPTAAPVAMMTQSIAPFVKTPGKVALLRALLLVARADGRVDAAEDKMLNRVRVSLDIDKKTFQRLRAEVDAAAAA